MAENLLGAITKGGYKGVADPMKESVKKAIDPNIMRTVYSAGLLGPIIKSIVKEYQKSEKPTDRAKTGDVKVVTDVSKNIRAMTMQLSSIASIMEDIRDLTKQQLGAQKQQFDKNQRQMKKSEFQSIEDKIEEKPKSITPLASAAASIKKADLGILGGLGANILGFVGNNPILSAVLGALLVGLSDRIQEFVGGFIKGSGLDEAARGGVDKLKGVLTEQVGNIFEGLGLSVSSEMSKIISSGLLTGLVTRLLFKRFKIGFLAGAAVEATNQARGGEEQLPANATPTEKLLSGLGITQEKLLAIAGAGAALWGGGKYLKGMGQPKTPTTTAPAPPIAAPTAPAKVITPSVVGGSGPYATSRPKTVRTAPPAQPSKPTTAGTSKPLSKNLKILKGGALLGAGLSAAGNLLEGDYLGALLTGGLTFAGGALGSFLGPWGSLAGGIGGSMLADYINQNWRNTSRSSGASIGGTQQSPADVQSTVEKFYQEQQDYMKSVMMAESGGDISAKAKTSSAAGLYGITKTTFDDVKKRSPGFDQSKTFEQMLGDAQMQADVMRRITDLNKQRLQQLKVPVTKENLYLAHHFGPDGAARLYYAKDKGALASSVLSAEAMKANSYLAGKSIQQVIDINASKMGKSSGAPMYAGDEKGALDAAFSAINAAPAADPRENIKMIRDLMAIEKALTGKQTIIVDNSQTNTQAGSGKTEERRSNPPVADPTMREHSIKNQINPGFSFWPPPGMAR